MPELAAGAQVAGHQIEAVAGRGGMGIVYRAVDLDLGRVVAMKVIADHLAAEPGFRERFNREARHAASLRSPHAATVYRYGDVDGLLFITMDLIEGRDLGEVLARERSLHPTRAAYIVAQVAEALDAAHGRGLVHRDVKPENVLVEPWGNAERAVLTDFGLARSLDGTRFSTTGAFAGTPNYAAPEQWMGGEVDPRTDIYALGALLFHMVSGEVPFPRPSMVSKMHAHLHEPPPLLRDRGFDGPVARALDVVVVTAMAKDPSARYPTAGTLGGAAVHAAAGTVSQTTRVESTQTQLVAPARRSAAVPIALAVLAAGALVMIVSTFLPFFDVGGERLTLWQTWSRIDIQQVVLAVGVLLGVAAASLWRSPAVAIAAGTWAAYAAGAAVWVSFDGLLVGAYVSTLAAAAVAVAAAVLVAGRANLQAGRLSGGRLVTRRVAAGAALAGLAVVIVGTSLDVPGPSLWGTGRALGISIALLIAPVVAAGLTLAVRGSWAPALLLVATGLLAGYIVGYIPEELHFPEPVPGAEWVRSVGCVIALAAGVAAAATAATRSAPRA